MNRIELSRKEVIASARQGPETSFYIMRHGATWQNAEAGISQDRERSWSQAPLMSEGADEARKAALKLKDNGIGIVFCSDLTRSCQTAEIARDILDVEQRSSAKLRPWNLGNLTNKLMTQANPQIAAYAKDKPDMAVPEGESFNDFKRRAFRGIAEAIGKYPGKTVLLVSHLRVESLLRAWHAAGQPISHEIDIDAFLKPGDPPGSFRLFTTHMPLLWGELDNKLTHAEANYRKGYEPEFCRTCEYSDHMTAPTCALVNDITRAGWCRLWEKAE
jgi:broad specificity phosphatase PhoE